jgi:hypothetical protein
MSPDRSRRPFSLDESTALLARTPLLLDVWLRGLPEGWLDGTEGGETWSPYVVVGHLIHGEKTDWMPRLRRILEHQDRVPFDSYDRFAQFRDSAGKTIGQLLDEFAALRAENLRQLAALGLDEAALDLPGRHPSLGAVSLRMLLATWVAHDYDHVIQIARVMANQYADEVGPWRAYLRVISGQPG